MEYQNSSLFVGAHWHGFSDTESGVKEYYWCVGTSTSTSECNLRSWENVGLHVSVSRYLTTDAEQGTQNIILCCNTKMYGKVLFFVSLQKVRRRYCLSSNDRRYNNVKFFLGSLTSANIDSFAEVRVMVFNATFNNICLCRV